VVVVVMNVAVIVDIVANVVNGSKQWSQFSPIEMKDNEKDVCDENTHNYPKSSHINAGSNHDKIFRQNKQKSKLSTTNTDKMSQKITKVRRVSHCEIKKKEHLKCSCHCKSDTKIKCSKPMKNFGLLTQHNTTQHNTKTHQIREYKNNNNNNIEQRI
jgi:hypothetical protein